MPVEDIWDVENNKYKAIVVVTKEARRIFQIGSQSSEKPVIKALERFVNHEIEYEEIQEEEEA